MARIGIHLLPRSFWENIEYIGLGWLFFAMVVLPPAGVNPNIAFPAGLIGFVFFTWGYKYVLMVLLTTVAGCLSANIDTTTIKGEPISEHQDIFYTKAGPLVKHSDGSWTKRYYMPLWAKLIHPELISCTSLLVRCFGDEIRDSDYGPSEVILLGEGLNYGHVAHVSLYEVKVPLVGPNVKGEPTYVLELGRQRRKQIIAQGVI